MRLFSQKMQLKELIVPFTWFSSSIFSKNGRAKRSLKRRTKLRVKKLRGIKPIIISPSKMGRANLCIDKTTIHFIYFFSTAIYQSTEIRVKKTKSESWQKSQKIFVRLLFPLHNASMTKQNRQNASCLEVIQSVSTRQKCSKLEAASTGKNINILLELDWLCSLSRVSSVCWH